MINLPKIDLLAEADFIAKELRDIVATKLRRKGLVVAISGGIDSSVSAALAVRALGAERVLGLILPERDSSAGSADLGLQLANSLGIRHVRHELASALDALGCYRLQEEALRRTLPSFGPGWRFKLAISATMGGKLSVTRVIARSPDGADFDERLPAADYLQLIAATNFKQRLRKTFDYYHADALGYAVVGTPNRLEYDQGFFVKLGDGTADIKPIAHLYKTQVYEMARVLGLPAAITSTTPTTDTFSLPQGQDEFYFGLPYRQMDIALHALNSGAAPEELAASLGCTVVQAQQVFAGIHAKRRATAYLHQAAILVRPVPEIA